MDIFSKLDLVDFSNTYILCDCANVNLMQDNGEFFESTFKFISWYQHTTRNVKYHFCSVISKENYFKCGGFDEQYSLGIASEDYNFIRRVEKAGMKVVCRKDLIVNHIAHPKDYSINIEEKKRLIGINTAILKKQIKSNKF